MHSSTALPPRPPAASRVSFPEGDCAEHLAVAGRRTRAGAPLDRPQQRGDPSPPHPLSPPSLPSLRTVCALTDTSMRSAVCFSSFVQCVFCAHPFLLICTVLQRYPPCVCRAPRSGPPAPIGLSTRPRRRTPEARLGPPRTPRKPAGTSFFFYFTFVSCFYPHYWYGNVDIYFGHTHMTTHDSI